MALSNSTAAACTFRATVSAAKIPQEADAVSPRDGAVPAQLVPAVRHFVPHLYPQSHQLPRHLSCPAAHGRDDQDLFLVVQLGAGKKNARKAGVEGNR